MIKFKMLIHKETGKVISYEEWLEYFRNNESMVFFNKEKTEKQSYKKTIAFDRFESKEMLFNDDFEIIYDSEFTESELDIIYADCKQKEVKKKIGEITKQRYDIEVKYGIEV